MASVQEYCRKLSTEKLEQILREYSEDHNAYSVEVILDILSILAEREQPEKDAHAAWQDFVKYYMPLDTENDL